MRIYTTHYMYVNVNYYTNDRFWDATQFYANSNLVSVCINSDSIKYSKEPIYTVHAR